MDLPYAARLENCRITPTGIEYLCGNSFVEKANNAPVRYSAKKTAKKVDTLKKGTKVEADKKEGSWYRIGFHRWIHTVRVSKTKVKG